MVRGQQSGLLVKKRRTWHICLGHCGPHDVVVIVRWARGQELPLLRVPGPNHVDEHVFGALTELGPDVVEMQVLCRSRM